MKEDYSILDLNLLIEKLSSLRDTYKAGNFIAKYDTGISLENFTCDNFYLNPDTKEFIINVNN
jgi:hypothetical protein